MLSCVHLCAISSDQLYTWSDGYTRPTRCSTPQTPQRLGASVAPTSIHSAWLPDRAIQAMWQARMQMRRWPWTWTQILSVGELSGHATADGLRAPGESWAGARVSRQLPTDARDSGRDLRDQPGVIASSRRTLKRPHEPLAGHLTRSGRCESWRRASGQYAGALGRPNPGEFIFCGGRR